MYCDSHPDEKLNFYCLDCRRPVCSHCLILGEHKSHQQTPIDQAFETGKETLGAWVDKLNQRVASQVELIAQLRDAEHEVNNGAEAQRNIINKEMDHLREILETKRHQLLSRSALEEKQKRVQLQAHSDHAENARKDAGHLVERSQTLLSLASEHAFLAVVLPLIQDMKKCAGQTLDAQPQVSTAYRPLTTDAQVRSLGDLDLGQSRTIQMASSSLHSPHQGHPQLQSSGVTAATAVPSSMAGPISMQADTLSHSSYGVMPPGSYGVANSTHSYLQPTQSQQVQYVYRSVPAQ
jgi:hypothetical protein